MTKILTWVAEADEIDRRRICDLVSRNAYLRLVGATDRVQSVASSAQPDLLLVNSDLVPRELQELQQLSRQVRGLRLVVYNRRPDLAAFLHALSLPVCGLLCFNHLSSDEFGRSLETIALGGAVIEPVAAWQVLERLRQSLPASTASPDLGQLSARENEVLGFVRKGLANKEIAARLRISGGTVRAHLRSIFRKLDVSSRTAAATAHTRV
jgi:DNA-binding NarL/FixJ family response regulator